jgi:H+/Cl- antiporter ClcA
MADRVRGGRLAAISAIAGCIGLAAGGAAFVLVRMIAMLTNVALLHRVSWKLPSFAHAHFGPDVVAVAAAGGFVVALLAKWSPVIKGHGIPEAMEAVLTKQSRISPRAALAKPLSAAIAIGTGGPFGAEGPIIVTGGSLGSLIGQVMKVSPSERKILLASGAAAGMAATFGAPIASVALAFELLLFEFSSRSFIPLVIASAVAGGVHVAVFGSGPLFAVPAHRFAGLQQLPLYIPLGIACGILAVVICKGLFAIEGVYRRLPVSEFWHPVIGGVGFGIVGMLVPRALGVGYPAITTVLAGRLALGVLLALGVAKLLAWWIALASGTSGGTLAPILLISGCMGGAIGHAAVRLFPHSGVSPGAFALVAMAATFGAATRATFTSIIFLFELTRDYHAILPLMLASVIADLIAIVFMRETIMTEKLIRRGLTVHSDYEPDVLRLTLVRDVMTRDVETVPADATVARARDLFASGHSAYPLVDGDGCCVGIATRGDLLRATDERAPLKKVVSRDVVGVAPNDTLAEALERLFEEDIEHLPVTADGRLVGILTRTDILHARRRRRADELIEPGWASRFARRRTPHVDGDIRDA